MRKGHNLCNSIAEYTEAQFLFLVFTDQAEIEAKHKNAQGEFAFSSGDDPREIKQKLLAWKKLVGAK